jgi:hypothetical protein
MSGNGDLRTDLVAKRAEAAARVLSLETTATAALLGGRDEKQIDALQVEISSTRERLKLLDRALKEHDQRQQLEAQQRMLDQTMAFVAPLTAPLDEAAAKLLLPPHTGPMRDLTPETVAKKTSFRWPGMPREGSSSRWNERLRGD